MKKIKKMAVYISPKERVYCELPTNQLHPGRPWKLAGFCIEGKGKTTAESAHDKDEPLTKIEAILS